MLDILITDGTVYDGRGGSARPLDVGVMGDRLALFERGQAPNYRRRIDAAGKVVCPGLIDPHSHSDLALLTLPDFHDKILQGVTTEVIGNCGISPYPIGLPAGGERDAAELGRELLWDVVRSVAPERCEITWSDAAGFFGEVGSRGVDANYLPLVGHGSLRVAAVGSGDGKLSSSDLARMQAMLRECIEQGAAGLSLGLLYPPGCYADLPELTALAAVVAEADGMLTCHIRDYVKHLLPSLQEVLDVAFRTHVRLRISHLMAVGADTAAEALSLLHAARERGLDVSYDQYPYERGMTSLQALLPPWMVSGGSPEMLRRLRDRQVRRRAAADIVKGLPGWGSLVHSVGWDNVSVVEPGDYAGKDLSFAEIAVLENCDPADYLFDLLVESGGAGTITMRLTSEEAIRVLLRDDLGCISTDGIPRKGLTHPRTLGTFARFLGHYCRDEHVLDWPQAIQRCTSLGAERFGIGQRGALEDGFFADVLILAPEAVNDRATYLSPSHPDGIEFVIVNGRIAVENGQPSGLKAGRRLAVHW